MLPMRAGLFGIAALMALLLGAVIVFQGSADGGDFSLDFVAAAPDDYDHTDSPATELVAGGLQYDARAINTNVVESLQGGDFDCGDTVVFFTKITVDSGAAGSQTIDIQYEFGAQNTGQDGVGYSDVVAVGLSAEGVFAAGQTTESGHSKSGNETATLQTGPTFNPGADPTWDPPNHDTMDLTVRVTGLEASELVIVRVDVRFSCYAAPVTGNLHASIAGANTVETDPDNNDGINVGQQTITMMGLGEVPTVTPTTDAPTETPTPTQTNTPTPTNTSPGPTATPTNTSPGPTATPTNTSPGPTATPTNTSPGPMATPTNTSPGPTATPTNTSPGPTATPTNTSPGPTATPTNTSPPPTATPTNTPPVVVLTATPTETPEDAATPTPTLFSETQPATEAPTNTPPPVLPDTGDGGTPTTGSWSTLGGFIAASILALAAAAYARRRVTTS